MPAADPWRRRAAWRRQGARRRGHTIPPADTRRGARVHTQRFLAIDGEGGNRDGKHIYTLLVAGGKDYADHVHNNGEQLTTEQCLEFILRQPKKRELISFFFNYDVTMILKDVDADTLKALCDRDSRTDPDTGKTKPVWWNEYGLDWIPGKMFIVMRRTRGRDIRRTIWDTAGFFQSSFVKALEGWRVGDAKERAFIQEMKGERADFTGEVTPQVIHYATTECVLLCKLLDLVYRESQSLGFTLRTFSGAGSLANSIMSKWHIDDVIQPPPDVVLKASWHAYFGGRFEAAAVGEIAGPIYEYDINSAYPAVIRTLPGLIGEWKRGEDITQTLRLYHVRWAIPRHIQAAYTTHKWSAEWGPFPWRNTSGGISYPASGEGWYWAPEVEMARRAYYGKHVRVIDCYTFYPSDHASPFGHVDELFQRRLAMKADKHLGERVIKLGLNSLYGKTAQAVGSRRFASPVWAGYITSYTRAMLQNAIRLAGRTPDGNPNVIMCATDAVYSLAPIERLPIGHELGQWEMQQHANMLIVQPGLYALNVGTESSEIRKTRGIRKATFGPVQVRDVWRKLGIYGSFEVPVTSFLGLRRGLASAKHDPGEWIDETRTISFFPRSKRLPIEIPDKRATFLATLPAESSVSMSAMYNPSTTSPDLAAYLEMVANDSYQPDGHSRPSVIPGFVTGE